MLLDVSPRFLARRSVGSMQIIELSALVQLRLNDAGIEQVGAVAQ